MPIMIALIGLFFPKAVIILLWLLTDWFVGVFETRVWPILGFLFMPLTLLWYSAVENWFYGDWNWWQIIVLIVAILVDFNSGRNTAG